MNSRHMMAFWLFGSCFAGSHAYAQNVATISCSGNGGALSTPIINVVYSPRAADALRPGLVWVALIPPDTSTRPYFYTLNSSWQQYQGGLFIPAARYDGGLPSSVTLAMPFPTITDGIDVMRTSTTDNWLGWTIYAGHGVLTDRAMQLVQTRRAVLESQRAEREANGTWPSDYESDDRMKWSLVMKDMDDNKKFQGLLTVPHVDCACETVFWGGGCNLINSMGGP